MRRLLTLSTCALTVALGATQLPIQTAHALPFSALNTVDADNSLVLVRDGCGRGMRFSNRRGGCVVDRSFDDRRFDNRRDRFDRRGQRRMSDEERAGRAIGNIFRALGADDNNRNNRRRDGRRRQP